MHGNKQCVFPTLRGNQHWVLSGSCSQHRASRETGQTAWLGCSWPLLRRRDFSCVPKASCWDGVCSTALLVENREGTEGPKKANQVKNHESENKKIRLCRIMTGPNHDPRKPTYKGQRRVLVTWERFQPKFLHERPIFLLHRKCKACFLSQGRFLLRVPFMSANTKDD